MLLFRLVTNPAKRLFVTSQNRTKLYEIIYVPTWYLPSYVFSYLIVRVCVFLQRSLDPKALKISTTKWYTFFWYSCGRKWLFWFAELFFSRFLFPQGLLRWNVERRVCSKSRKIQDHLRERAQVVIGAIEGVVAANSGADDITSDPEGLVPDSFWRNNEVNLLLLLLFFVVCWCRAFVSLI